jgi:hypothetical protein
MGKTFLSFYLSTVLTSLCLTDAHVEVQQLPMRARHGEKGRYLLGLEWYSSLLLPPLSFLKTVITFLAISWLPQDIFLPTTFVELDT